MAATTPSATSPSSFLSIEVDTGLGDSAPLCTISPSARAADSGLADQLLLTPLESAAGDISVQFAGAAGAAVPVQFLGGETAPAPPAQAEGTGRQRRGRTSNGDDGSAPESKRRRTQQDLDRRRRARVTSAVGLLREATGAGRKADKAEVLESSLRELERLRTENAALRAFASAPQTSVFSGFHTAAGLLCFDWRSSRVVDISAGVYELGFRREVLIGRSWPQAMAVHFGVPTGSKNPFEPCQAGPTERAGPRNVLEDPSLSPRVRGWMRELKQHRLCCADGDDCVFRKDDMDLLSGRASSLTRVRTLAYADGSPVRMRLTRWLVSCPATREPLYFVCLGHFVDRQ